MLIGKQDLSNRILVSRAKCVVAGSPQQFSKEAATAAGLPDYLGRGGVLKRVYGAEMP